MRLKVLVVDDEPLAREGSSCCSAAAAGRIRLGSAKRTGGGRPHSRAEAGPGPARRADAAHRRLCSRPGHRRRAHATGDLRDRARSVCDSGVRDRGDRLSAQAGHGGALCARVQASLGRLRGVPHEEGTRQVLAMLDAVANPPRQLERFAVRSGERTIFVPVDEVEWIEAFQNYVRLHAGRRPTCCTCP